MLNNVRDCSFMSFYKSYNCHVFKMEKGGKKTSPQLDFINIPVRPAAQYRM